MSLAREPSARMASCPQVCHIGAQNASSPHTAAAQDLGYALWESSASRTVPAKCSPSGSLGSEKHPTLSATRAPPWKGCS